MQLALPPEQRIPDKSLVTWPLPPPVTWTVKACVTGVDIPPVVVPIWHVNAAEMHVFPQGMPLVQFLALAIEEIPRAK
jgi:hypothetical protein